MEDNKPVKFKEEFYNTEDILIGGFLAIVSTYGYEKAMVILKAYIHTGNSYIIPKENGLRGLFEAEKINEYVINKARLKNVTEEKFIEEIYKKNSKGIEQLDNIIDEYKYINHRLEYGKPTRIHRLKFLVEKFNELTLPEKFYIKFKIQNFDKVCELIQGKLDFEAKNQENEQKKYPTPQVDAVMGRETPKPNIPNNFASAPQAPKSKESQANNTQQPVASSKIKMPYCITFDYQATMESDYARTNSMQVVKVVPGSEITDVAKEMCGKRYIGKFNDFLIDGTKYTSPEQIVEAYYEFSWGSRNKKEQNNKAPQPTVAPDKYTKVKLRPRIIKEQQVEKTNTPVEPEPLRTPQVETVVSEKIPERVMEQVRRMTSSKEQSKPDFPKINLEDVIRTSIPEQGKDRKARRKYSSIIDAYNSINVIEDVTKHSSITETTEKCNDIALKLNRLRRSVSSKGKDVKLEKKIMETSSSIGRYMVFLFEYSSKLLRYKVVAESSFDMKKQLAMLANIRQLIETYKKDIPSKTYRDIKNFAKFEKGVVIEEEALMQTEQVTR